MFENTLMDTRLFTIGYREKVDQKIKERLKLSEGNFHQKPTTIKVLDLQNQWAFWTLKNGPDFHRKLAMAPVQVLDYIIKHEMVHLKHSNHSTDFWNEFQI